MKEDTKEEEQYEHEEARGEEGELVRASQVLVFEIWKLTCIPCKSAKPQAKHGMCSRLFQKYKVGTMDTPDRQSAIACMQLLMNSSHQSCWT